MRLNKVTKRVEHADTTVLDTAHSTTRERTLVIMNTGHKALASCVVYVSPEKVVGQDNWMVLDNTTFATLASGAVKKLEIDTRCEAIKVVATTAEAEVTEVTLWLL